MKSFAFALFFSFSCSLSYSFSCQPIFQLVSRFENRIDSFWDILSIFTLVSFLYSTMLLQIYFSLNLQFQFFPTLASLSNLDKLHSLVMMFVERSFNSSTVKEERSLALNFSSSEKLYSLLHCKLIVAAAYRHIMSMIFLEASLDNVIADIP